MFSYISDLIRLQAPSYHLFVEAFLVIWVLWLLRRKKNGAKEKVVLTLEEEETIIKAWRPKPLVHDLEGEEEEEDGEKEEEVALWGEIESRPGKFVVIEGVSYLNLATNNFLGLVDEGRLDEEAERCVRRYGVGSCGPRGFYGTVDVHLQLEEKIAAFLGLEETALYSYGFSTIASAIPSYSKAGDIIFVDEEVNFCIQKGLQASRSQIRRFRHNDAEHLQELLSEQEKVDRKNTKKAKTVRRFCVVEGIYQRTGQMCPLDKIAKLTRKHKVRLFVDETLSFGVVGKTGRGVTEELNVPVEDVDLISGSLEHAFAAFGGFVVGTSFVVDHQRISGLGYCFSASLPPLLAGVGITALSMIEEDPALVQELQENCKYMHRALKELSQFDVSGHELTPAKHIMLKEREALSRREQEAKLNQIILYVKEKYKIALIQPAYLEKQEYRVPPPSIRVAVNRLLTKEEMDQVVQAIEAASNNSV